MNIIKKFVISILLFAIILSISTVSANENVTDEVSMDNDNELNVDEVSADILTDDDYLEDDIDGEPIKAKIYVSSYSSFYDSSKKLQVQVKDLNGNPLKGVTVKFKFSNDVEYLTTGSSGKCSAYVPESVGLHKATISLDDYNYVASAKKVTVKITKAPVKISAKKIKTDTASHFKLKATVKDKYGYLVTSGTVKFKFNGKTYKVKVKDGIATKKLKIKKAKTIKYKATFSAKNYKTKSASSKVIIKKVYVIKKGGYSFKLTKNQYNRIQYVKNHAYSSHLSKYANYKIKTSKYYYGMPVYAVVTTWSGIMNGHYYNYPQVQFVTMYSSDPWDWDYLTGNYKI